MGRGDGYERPGRGETGSEENESKHSPEVGMCLAYEVLARMAGGAAGEGRSEIIQIMKAPERIPQNKPSAGSCQLSLPRRGETRSDL